MTKDFDKWNKLKKDLHQRESKNNFREGEVWWCSFGLNVGFEEDGKNLLYERPVLVIRKFSKELFIGLPLTTTKKQNKFYHQITVGDENGVVILSQSRAISPKRLQRRMAKISHKQLNSIKSSYFDLIKSAPHKGEPRVPDGNLYSNNSNSTNKSQSGFDVNEIVSYQSVCENEKFQLQKGMNFDNGRGYSIVLMSTRKNSPYQDEISDDELTIYYEGHDQPKDTEKLSNQPELTDKGSLTENGKFAQAIRDGRDSKAWPLVKVYDKLQSGIWSYRGIFQMTNYEYVERNNRMVFVFRFDYYSKDDNLIKSNKESLDHDRQIPGEVKLEVYERDNKQCVKCGSKDNLHFDHILPFSKGGTSKNADNIQLLCQKHNLQKSDKLNDKEDRWLKNSHQAID